MITQEDIRRINDLARRSRTAQGLTPEERREQMELRRRYVEAVRANLTAQLERTVILEPDGSRRPLRPKAPPEPEW